MSSSMFGRRWAVQVERETESARTKFPHEHHPTTRVVWLAALVEEVGKLTRACNKLLIASAPDVRQQWRKEGAHRLVTIASLARRMAEAWDEMPDKEAAA